MKVLSIRSTFIATLLVALAFGTAPSCNNVISLSTFLNDSYQANANLIRFGAPSEIVRALYDHSLIEMASSCECSTTTVDQFCVHTIFNLDNEVSVLRSTIDTDATTVGTDKLFRLYDSSKVLDSLAANQIASLEFCRTHLLSLTPDTTTIKSPAWQRSIFPSDDVFFQDDASGQKDACNTFNAVTHPQGLTYPASSATAYVIGLVQSVRKAKLDMAVPLQILANHTTFVYNGVRCNKLSGDRLHIPVTYLEDYKKTIESILSSASTDTGILRNVRELLQNSKMFLPSLVDKLSALISYGDSATVLVANAIVGNPSTVTRDLVELTLAADPSLLVTSMPGMSSIGMGQTQMNSPGGVDQCALLDGFLSREQCP
ncbi:hypothetical protein BWQ96_00862 [Gracilariopsis chorda]|uniref:Uncharacterized protein n=1 Tax=Gracilariopsis chorda TaxID=448386 RepID=A0A2V3J4E3_9FLOR|nr:hypothetical protein BWQ96_00862 [Gracilariopsis chorda]|eukprot:PXF49288.1 hypothetical protein BWQ96_00862 [Gracilariopsis chorda]